MPTLGLSSCLINTIRLHELTYSQVYHFRHSSFYSCLKLIENNKCQSCNCLLLYIEEQNENLLSKRDKNTARRTKRLLLTFDTQGKTSGRDISKPHKTDCSFQRLEFSCAENNLAKRLVGKSVSIFVRRQGTKFSSEKVKRERHCDGNHCTSAHNISFLGSCGDRFIVLHADSKTAVCTFIDT